MWCLTDKRDVTPEWSKGVKTANMGVLDIGIALFVGKSLNINPP